jgi:hypothetical protein
LVRPDPSNVTLARVKASLRDWISDAAVTRAFYASVVYAAVVTVYASDLTDRPPVIDAMWAVVATAAILFLAHGFAEYVPMLARTGRVSLRDLRTVLRNESPLLFAALVPIVPLALARAGAISSSAGYLWSVRLTLLGLFLLASGLSRRDGLSWGRSLGAGLAILIVTSLLILLEAALGH